MAPTKTKMVLPCSTYKFKPEPGLYSTYHCGQSGNHGQEYGPGTSAQNRTMQQIVKKKMSVGVITATKTKVLAVNRIGTTKLNDLVISIYLLHLNTNY